MITRIGLALALAGAVAAVVGFASASATPPPGPKANFGFTRAQPVAGETFTGLTVTPAGYRVTDVDCGNAWVGGKQIPARSRRFRAFLVAGPSAVTCSWKIPADATGKMLRLPYSSADTIGGKASTSGVSWRIK